MRRIHKKVLAICLCFIVILGSSILPQMSSTVSAAATVATPTFSPAGGTYTSTQTVTINCATAGATIRYTTNGSTPTTSSPVYSGPITVSTTTTIKAIGIKSGMTKSRVASATYTMKVETPTFSPAGGTYTSTQTVTISCTTAGATIRYTTNGTTPTTSSPIYSSPITVSSTTTVKAIAIKSGMTNSSVASATYTMKVATPIFSPAGGTYSTSQTVAISCATAGATIRYTTNGTTPTTSSPVYSSPIAVSATTTVKAIAIKSGMTTSDVASATYTMKVATPVFSPAGGTYTSNQMVAISCATSGATIRYTTDGSIPTSSSQVYSGPISVFGNMTIKAYATKTGMTNSDVGSSTYTIAPKILTPTISPTEGTYTTPQTVTISCATEGVTIRYTTDGSTPTATSPIYVGPITVSGNTIIKTYATKVGMTDSDIVSVNYIIAPVIAAPTFSPAGGTYTEVQTVTMSCATEGVTIRYTTDGSTPTPSSPVYSGPITVSSNTTIKAYATKVGMTDSSIASNEYIIVQKVETPMFTPVGGIYDTPQTVSINCNTQGVTMRYTTDGSTPTSGSLTYSGPITVSESMTIKAFAIKTGMTDSDVASVDYSINITPAPATDLKCIDKTDTTATLSWIESPGSSVIGYDIYNGGMLVASINNATSYIINRLKPSNTYIFKIKTRYSDGSVTDFSNSVTVVTDRDITAPTTPSALAVYARHDTSLTITWEPSQDNDSVAGYEIYKSGYKLATTKGNTYTDSGLVPSTTCNYTVKSYDVAGNRSGISSALTLTTLSNDDNPNDLADANPISVGTPETARIDYDGDVDYFCFDTVWTGTYSVESTGTADTYAELYDSTGNMIASNNDSSLTNKNVYMKVNLSQYNKYYLKVKKNTSGTGSYSVMIKLVSKVQTSSATSVSDSMGQKLSDLNAVAVNGKIYAMGGHNYLTGGTSSKINVYDTVTGIWTLKQTVMPMPVWDFGMTAIGDRIYVAGGAKKGCTDKAYEYDTVSDTWKEITPLSSARKGLGLVALNGKLYAIGGTGDVGDTGKAGYTSALEVFDTENQSAGWITKTRMPTPRAGFAIAVLGNKIYVIGGHNKDGQYLDTVEVYDISNDSWTTLQAKMPNPKTGCRAVVRSGKIYVIGGFGGNNSFLNDVDVFDPAAGTWSTYADLEVSRMGLAVAETNGRIYVMGGRNSDGCTDSVEEISAFKFRIKTMAANEVYSFPININTYNSYNIMVDWGDGIVGSIATYSERSHIYALPGTYTIKVISFLRMPLIFLNDNKLIEIVTPIPNNGANSFGKLFSGCRNLAKIPTGLFDNNVNVSDFSYCFEYCSSLTTIPAGLFNKNVNVANFSYCFYDCINLTTIPAGLFDKNIKVTNFSYCFTYCSSLTTIPASLFDNNINVFDFGHCFQYCFNLTTIPAGLFDKNVNVTNFGGCFSDCSNLTTIPAGLFDKNVKATNFSSCFSSCDNLTTIPAGLFDKNVNVTDFSWCFYECYNLATIPAGLFDKNVNATDFSYCFCICSSLTTIPAGLFDKNVKATNFSHCFDNCVNLTGLAPTLWLRSPQPSGYSCFCSCYNLSNYAEIPSTWKS